MQKGGERAGGSAGHKKKDGSENGENKYESKADGQDLVEYSKRDIVPKNSNVRWDDIANLKDEEKNF